MKICQLCAVDFTLYHFLLPLMRAMREKGHEVVGVCSDGPLVARARAEGFRIEATPIVRGYNPLEHWKTFGALVRLFRAERFDLLHVHTPVAALIGRLAAARAGVPTVVYTAHGFYFHERMPLWKRALFGGLEYLGGRFTDILLTQSAEDAQTARRFGLCRGGIVEAIGNGSDPQRFHPVAADAPERLALRQSLGVDERRPVVAMIGRLVAEKGYPELFAAMRDVDAQLWVIGERLKSDHAQPIDALIDAVQRDPILGRRVQFLGYRQDVPALLRAADIFALPSHREGMPRSIIEAMLSGLPVVATDIRGSREEVIDGESGYLVPLGDVQALARALQRLAADQALRKSFGQAGRERAAELFDERKIVARQLALLKL
ncbi:MAG TPA: glycosyltransferase family 4 protein [Alphaproteobacteria bacterium]|nr:glycosyltransferase family 4 protein [Alphaproteobacteria bacterium]